MDEFATWADVAERLRRLKDDEKRGAQSRLAKDFLGMDPSQVSRNLRGAGNLTVEQARQAAAFFAGKDPVGRPATRETFSRRLPVFGRASPDEPDLDRFAFGEPGVIDMMEPPMGLTLGPGDYFIVLQPSSTMEPRIYAGEAQIARRDYPPQHGKKSVIEFIDGTATVKVYRGQRDGHVFAEQFNPPKIVSYEATTVRRVHPIIFSF